jgi:serine phosphatase RsbU (regulator of sigma subunit)
LLTEAKFEDEELKLQSSDRLMFVTDGVLEAADHDGEFFGDQRLETLLGSECSVASLFRALDVFRNGTPLQDDCTALMVHYVGK